MFATRVIFVSFAALGLIAAGCSSDGESADSSSSEESASHTFDFGQPAEAGAADRVVEITAADDFTFDPDTVEVEAGEIVTFSVTNSGDLPHEFVLGPEDVQEEHEAEMEEMGDSETGDMAMDDDPNAVSVPAGETADLTWEFTEAGTVLMGCHTQGHWTSGMRGEIDVAEAA